MLFARWELLCLAKHEWGQSCLPKQEAVSKTSHRFDRPNVVEKSLSTALLPSFPHLSNSSVICFVGWWTCQKVSSCRSR